MTATAAATALPNDTSDTLFSRGASRAEKRRQFQLDSLRALGLIIVIYVHTRVRGNLLGEAGPLALAMFFVLSGFLITGILLDARARAERIGYSRGGVLGRFYIRRFLRIFPIFYAVLGIAMILGEPVTRRYIVELATYRANFLMAHLGRNMPPITPLWSLAVEEHFYAFWPLIVLFLPRRAIWTSIVIMIVGSIGIRGLLAFHGAPYQAIAWPTYSAVDSIAVGCALAIVWRDTTLEQREPWILWALVIGIVFELARLALYIYPDFWHAQVIGRTLNTFPFALVSVWLVDRGARDRLPRWMSNIWLARLGLVSYAVYVMHRYVMHYLGVDQARGWLVFAATLVVSVALATLSWLIYEGPINRLNRYWPYVPRQQPQPLEIAGAATDVVQTTT